jgi:hypothetical protein
MRVTNLASYFDGIISSHDYDVAKEKQEFWQQLEDEIKFDKAKSIFFDDSQCLIVVFLANNPDNTNGVCLLLRVGLDRVYLWLHHRLYCVF